MKTLLSIFSLIISVALSAQDSTFNKRYYDNEGSDIGSMMISPNNTGGFVVCGGNYDYRGLILDIDSLGGINWNRTIQSDSSYSLTTDVFTSSDSSIVVSGYNYSSSYDSIKSIFCAKFNFQGDTLWTNTFQLSNTHGYSQYDYVGTSELDSNTYLMVASSLTDSLIKVSRMKESGSIDWERKIEGALFDVNTIKVDSDSTFLIGGSVDNVDGFIFKLDQMGNILWSKRYFSQEVFDLASVGTNLFSISRDTQSSKSLWLIKLDSVGSAIWSEPTFVRYEHYSKGLLNSVPQILNIGDSLLAISGSGVEIKDTSGVALNGLDIFPMRWAHIAKGDSDRVFISGNGPFYGIKANTIYEHHFGVIFTNTILDESDCTWDKVLYDNDTIAVDTDTLIASNNSNSSSFRQTYTIDSLPLVLDNECVEFFGNVEEQESTQLSVYPNITSGETNFELSKPGQYQVEILDVKGNNIGVFEIDGSYGSFDLSNQPAGIYFYKVYNESTNLTGKIIKR
tara:strand:+ start:117047 stop:118573 length:1527 start_codon:yes stop_codon:yes gene_type:complete